MSEKEKEQNTHIDDSRTDENKYLVQEDIKELYEREFGEALENYNAKQTRSDRKIKDYYKHIEASKKTSTQQEMIVQIGDKDDFTNENNRQLANEILEEWFHGFEKRNVNLKVYNAVIHNDEASPHMHLNFVPVADGYKRGLEKQVAFDRAIKQQDSTLNKTRPFQDWREKEVNLLAEMLKERGIERKFVGKNEYKDVNEYKQKKDLEREVEELEQDLSNKKNELLAFNEQVPNEIKVPARRQMKNVEVPTGEKNLFGKEKTKIERKPTGNVVVPEDNFKKLVSAAKDNKQLKGSLDKMLNTDIAKANKEFARAYKRVSLDLDAEKRVNKELRTENMGLKRQNSNLNNQISDLQHEIKLLYQSTREFLKERTNDFKTVLRGFIDKVREKTPNSKFERLHEEIESKAKRNKFSLDGVKELDQETKKQKRTKRNRSHDLEL